MQLRIEPLGVAIAVAPGHTLLQAALAHGITLRSSCRNGSCRACMAQLLSGQVSYRVEWPGVLREERAQGWTLPCVAVPVGDVVLMAADACLAAGSAATNQPALPAVRCPATGGTISARP